MCSGEISMPPLHCEVRLPQPALPVHVLSQARLRTSQQEVMPPQPIATPSGESTYNMCN